MGRVNTISFQIGNFQRDALVPFTKLFRKLESEPGTSWCSNGTRIFQSEIPFGNFGLPFKKFRFPVEISVREEKNSLPIYIPSEISGFFGLMVNNHSLF